MAPSTIASAESGSDSELRDLEAATLPELLQLHHLDGTVPDVQPDQVAASTEEHRDPRTGWGAGGKTASGTRRP